MSVRCLILNIFYHRGVFVLSAQFGAVHTQGSLGLCKPFANQFKMKKFVVLNQSIRSTAFVSTNAKYGIPLSRYTVFYKNCPCGTAPKHRFFSCEIYQLLYVRLPLRTTFGFVSLTYQKWEIINCSEQRLGNSCLPQGLCHCNSPCKRFSGS